jgi:proteasome lid subunit RPN8/RPN11
MVEVVAYRGDDYVPELRLQAQELLREFFAPLLHRSLKGCLWYLRFLPVADLTPLPGQPELVNLRGSHGYLLIQILSPEGELLYQHPHPVREVIGRPLQRRLAEYDGQEAHWGFGIEGKGLEAMPLVRPVPAVAGEVRIDSRDGRPRRFNVEEVPPPPPPLLSLRDLGLAPPEGDQPVSVVLPQDVFEAFTSTMAFDTDVEDGGFLAGTVHRDSENESRYIVQITAVLPAERTGASLLAFTFTGESFLRIVELLELRGAGEQLVGWYHTHLFPATDDFGLSSIDVRLHKSTFRQPWQVAALVNLHQGSRTLRFYGSEGEELRLARYLVSA